VRQECVLQAVGAHSSQPRPTCVVAEGSSAVKRRDNDDASR
jgi:hypothetical protein